jgi:hypothetical protein
MFEIMLEKLAMAALAMLSARKEAMIKSSSMHNKLSNFFS